MSRDLSDLYVQTRRRIAAAMAELEARGLAVKVTDTYRSFARQAELYAQGRTAPGRIVTNAQPGQSFHNVRRAVDFALLRPDGALDWDWMASASARSLWGIFGEVLERHGLHWGGRWAHPDKPHAEDSWCDPCQLDVGPRDAEHFDERGECRANGPA